MGFIPNATTTTLTAKLTPIGRQLLRSTNNNLITKFSLGDSDANYYAAVALSSGSIPGSGGDMALGNLLNNSVGNNISIKSFLLLNNTGTAQKAVESESNTITTEIKSLGLSNITGLTHNIINRLSGTTDPLVNLYYTFGLPLNSSQDALYTATTTSNGGFAQTALSGIAQNKILSIAIPNSQYGELIDGKSIKLSIKSSGQTFDIYSTFQNKGLSTQTEDANYTDSATQTKNIGNNIAFLFTDSIQKPGNNTNLSWSTGYGTYKPFSQNGKQLYNFTTNTNIGQTADTCVGIAYLDKGFLVITNPTIVDNFSLVDVTATTLSLDSTTTVVQQNITCIAGRGEFGRSNNPTFGISDTARISELGLYDDSNNLIAIGKLDRHVLKDLNQFMVLNVKIEL